MTRPVDASSALAALRAVGRPGEVKLPEDVSFVWVDATADAPRPRWRLEASDGTFGEVDGRTGRVLRADLPAELSRARLRLVFLLLLAMFAAFSASELFQLGGVLFRLVVLLVGAALPPWLLTTVGAGLGLWLAYGFSVRLGRLTPQLFTEPLARAVTGRIRVPLAFEPERALLRITGVLMLASAGAVLLEVSLKSALGDLPSLTWPIFRGVLALGMAVLSFSLSGGRSPQPTRPPASSLDEGWSELVNTALLATRYVLTTYLFWAVLQASGVLPGVYESVPRALPPPGQVRDWLLELSVIAATVHARLAPTTRLPLLAGLLAGFVAKQPLGMVGELLISSVSVTLAVKSMLSTGWRSALLVSLRFETGAVAGRVGGRLLLGLLLGPAGVLMGEVLGAQLAGAIGLRASPELQGQNVNTESSERALEWTRPLAIRMGAVGVLLGVWLLSTGQARLFDPGFAPPGDWTQLSSTNFTAQLPEGAATQRETWTLDSPYARGWSEEGRPQLEVTEHSVKQEASRFFLLEGRLPQAAASEETGTVQAVLDLALKRQLRLIHLMRQQEAFMGVSRDGRDVRCFLRRHDRAFVLACSEGPASEGALIPGEAAFFAGVRVRTSQGDLQPLVVPAELKVLHQELWPAYFREARKLAAMMGE